MSCKYSGRGCDLLEAGAFDWLKGNSSDEIC